MADVQGLLQSRLTTYDPELDVSSGSLVDTVIIQPIVKALQADALLTDSKEFLLQKFYEGFPDYPATDGDAITDILINAASLFFEAYRVELNRIKKAQSIVNYAEMSESELDALAANWLVYRRQGSLATGTVRVIVNRLAAVSITRNVLFTAKNGKTFSPTISYIVTLSELSINALGNGQYYFDLDVIATTTGLSGNIGAFEISSSSGIPSVISVYNEAGFIGGSDADTNDSLSTNRLMRSITERSLVTTRGISARLDSLSSSIKSSQVIGFGDDEMVRDRVDIVGNGALLGQGIGYFEDNICIISGMQGLANLVEGNYLVDNVNNIVYNITDVIGKSDQPCFTNSGNTLIVKTDKTITPAYCAYIAAFSKASISLSNEEFAEYAHIGGKTDVYLSVSDEVDVTTSLNLLKQDSDLSGIGITITNFYAKIDQTLHKNLDELIDMYLIVTHSETFVAKIFAYDVINGSTVLYYDFDFGETLILPSASWEICKTISVGLSESFTTIYPQNSSNEQLEVLFNIDDIRVRSNVDLTLSNVKSGDFIQIETGGYKGNYEISRVAGRTLFLSSPPAETTNRLAAKIVRSKSAVPSPISYVNSVSVQGEYVPYSKALGLEILHAGGASESASGVGFVSGSFHYFVKQAMSAGDSDFKTSLKVLSPTLIKEISNGDLVHDITLEDGSCILSFKEKKIAGVDFLLPNDLLVPNSNNIFIAMGNITSTSKSVDYPVQAGDGDVLQILDGENKGKYIIQRVYNIKIPLTTNNISRNPDKNTTIKVSRSHGKIGNWRMVSIVRIYGEFPVNIYETFAESYRVPFTKEISNSGGDVFVKRYFDANYMLLVFTDQSLLIDQSAVGGRLRIALQQLQTSSGINVNSDTVSDIPMNTIRTALNLSATCNYTVGKASTAYGEIVIRDNTQCILPSYTYRPYTLSNVAALMSGQPLQKNYNKPIFTADYFGSKFIAKCGLSRSLISGVDVQDINTFLSGIGGDSVNALVPTSNIIKSRFVDNIDSLRLDTITYSGIDINPKKDDELHVLHEVLLFNSAIPKTQRQYVGYMPCISTLSNIPNGFLTSAQVMNAVSGFQNVVNHKGDAPSDVYSMYINGTNYTYVFYEIDEGVYTDSNYIESVSISGIQPLTFDAYYFSTQLITNKTGLGLASGIANNNSIYVEKQFDSLQDNLDLDNIVGKHLRVIGGVNAGVYNITGCDSENRLIFLDKSLQQSTMPVLNRGICFYRGDDAGKLFVIGSPGTTINSSGNAEFVGLDTDYNSGVGLGITSRYLTPTDSGKYITLYNYVKDDRSDETLGNIGVIRQNIGCYKISAVSSTTRNSTILGASTVAYQTVSVDIPDIAHILGASADNNTFIGIFFILTDEPSVATQIIEDGLTTVSTLTAFQIYEPTPIKYKIAAISTDHSTAYISAYGYAGAPSSFGDPLFVKEGSSTHNYTYNTNNPLTFVRPGEVSVNLSNKVGELYFGGVNLQSLGHDQEYNTYTNKVFITSNEVIGGYNIETDDISTSYSDKEKLTLNIQPIINGVSVINQLADISTVVSNAISTSQGLVGNTDERVVCSDTLVKRMLPCFIGADISYVGGPTELDATDHLVRIISNTLSTRSISISTIVRELHKLGATRVVLPIKMYYIVEDLQRTRHYRIIEDVLSIDQDIRIDGSTRIMSRDVAPYNKSKLGSTIKLTRLVEISTIGKG